MNRGSGRIALCLALSLALAVGSSSEELAPAPIATTDRFAFFSDLDTNLHDALIVAGAARREGKDELFLSGDEAACFGKLAPSARKGWSLAVDYYAEIVTKESWNGRAQVAMRYALGGFPSDGEERNRDLVAITRGMLAAAAPAYEACAWPARDAMNRAWMEDLAPRLARHEDSIATRLESLYGVAFHGLPMRVDIVAAAPPLGANTWILDPGGHILISTTMEGNVSLETVLHEASHTLAAPWRPDPLPKALGAAAKELGVEVPRDLWHVVLFHTTGEVVREVLAAAGEPGYVPMVESLWRGSWAPLEEPVKETWPAYLRGDVSLEEASRALVGAIGRQGGARD